MANVSKHLDEYKIPAAEVKGLAWFLTMFAGLTMVSNLKFYSGKDINPRKSVSFPAVVAIALAVVALAAAASTLPEMLFMIFAVYGMSGYVIAGVELAKRGKRADRPSPPDVPGA